MQRYLRCKGSSLLSSHRLDYNCHHILSLFKSWAYQTRYLDEKKDWALHRLTFSTGKTISLPMAKLNPGQTHRACPAKRTGTRSVFELNFIMAIACPSLISRWELEASTTPGDGLQCQQFAAPFMSKSWTLLVSFTGQTVKPAVRSKQHQQYFVASVGIGAVNDQLKRQNDNPDSIVRVDGKITPTVKVNQGELAFLAWRALQLFECF